MKKIFMCAMLALLLPFSIMLTGCFGGDKNYNIELQQVENGHIYCVLEAKEGEEVTLYYENIETGYEFICFTLNGEQLEGNTFTMPSEDVTVSAVIDKIQYTITYHIDNDTSFVNPSNKINSYTIGTTANLPEIQKDGYNFDSWCTDEELQNEISSITFTMYGNLDLYPKFNVVSHTINYHYDGQVTNNNPSSYDITSGTITLNNAEKQDYEFRGWYDNATFTGNKITTIPAGTTGTINLYAKFISTKVDNEGYRLITSAVDFMEIIPEDLDGKYRVQGQISFEGYNYTPIGDESNPFTGELDYYSGYLRDISITSMDEYAGLFGYIKNATITGISIGDIEINIPTVSGSTNKYIGALAAYADNCTIDDIDVAYADIYINSYNAYVGSLIGYVKNSTITNCEVSYSPIQAFANYLLYAGGISGRSVGSTISKCSVNYKGYTHLYLETKQLENAEIYYGGIVGEGATGTTIENSYVWQENSYVTTQLNGKSSTSYTGGLVGLLSNASSLTNCYAQIVEMNSYDAYSSTTEKGKMYLAGLVGTTSLSSTITNSFLTTDKNRSSYSLELNCSYSKGYIVANTEYDIQITNCFVDSQISFVGETSNILDGNMITFASLTSIKSSLNWDTAIWNLNFYGANIGPILK